MTNPQQPILLVEDSDEDYEATLRAFRSAHVANPLHRCATGDEALDEVAPDEAAAAGDENAHPRHVR